MTDRTPTTEAGRQFLADVLASALPGSPSHDANIEYVLAIEDEARAPLVAIRGKLEQLRDHGYQPMYNGRPSCPFCTAFIDYEMTHYTDCSLVEALSREPQP